jgi:hypothetical protein
LLGAAFLGVVATSLVSGVMVASATGMGTMSEMLAHVAGNVTAARVSVLMGVLTSAGIVTLAALL